VGLHINENRRRWIIKANNWATITIYIMTNLLRAPPALPRHQPLFVWTVHTWTVPMWTITDMNSDWYEQYYREQYVRMNSTSFTVLIKIPTLIRSNSNFDDNYLIIIFDNQFLQ
jgi:hypothetical protein